MTDARPLPYDRLQVVELAGDPAGEMLGKLLAQYGAKVTKVEPPGGSPTRRTGPFAGDVKEPDASLTFWYYNLGKTSVTLDPASETADRDRLEALLQGADVAIVSCPPSEWAQRGVDPHAWSAIDRLIVCCISPFGLTGPWRDYRSSDLVAMATGGVLNSCGYDDHSIPPIRPPENQAYHMAASFAHLAVLLALMERDETGNGQTLDVSIHDSVAVSSELANPYWFYPEVLVQRQTCRHAQPTPTAPALFQTLDGRYVYFALVLADIKPWTALVDWMAEAGMAADLVEPEYGQLAHRQANFPHIQQILEAFCLVQEAATLYEEGQSRGLPIAVVNSPDEVVEDEHLVARRFFQRLERDGEDLGLHPGPPMHFSSYRAAPPEPPPRLGAYGREVRR
jgi:crotonobetainyl-CoA:carnitine CoA-transferase CaiB-like acyl-CoA transferase